MITIRISTIAFIFAVATCSVIRPISGQEAESANSPSQLQQWRDHYLELAKTHRFLLGDDETEEAVLQQAPLHFYSNPAGGTQSHGSIFVWTENDRPVVLGALWSRKIGNYRHVSASFHSTATNSLRGLAGETEFWKPARTLTMKPWPGNIRRAVSAPRRLAQMRAMMRSLEAIRTHQEQQTQLRLLPQPLCRYQNDKIADGAIFGFFEDWDPELFVLVESPIDQPDRWVMGVVRFSNKRLELRLEGQNVWEYDPAGPEPPLGGPSWLYVSNLIENRPAIFSEP